MSCILLPYHSMILWYCRKWDSIFEIAFYQSNYLSTILHTTQSTERSHQLPLNNNDPGHGRPWRLFFAKCRGRLLFVIYASRGALCYSTASQSLFRPAHCQNISATFQITNSQFCSSNKKVAIQLITIYLHYYSFTVCSIMQITSANKQQLTHCLPKFTQISA